MEFVPNTHSDTYHVDMTMQDCIDRILNEQTTAASAFLDANTRDILTQETIRLCQPTIDQFLCDYNGDNRITLTHAFTEADAIKLNVPTTHLGVILDRDTNRIWIMTTNLVSVILLRDNATENGYRIDNSYPNVASTKYSKKLNINPLPYVMSSNTWTSLNMMQRVMWRIRCNHQTTYSVTYANIAKGLILDIIEDDENLGTVIVTSNSALWNVTRDAKPLSVKHNTHKSLLARAFPETSANVRDVCAKIEDDKFDISLNLRQVSISDVMDIRNLIRKPPTTNETKLISSETETSNKLANAKKNTIRGKKHALSRSKNANRNSGIKKQRKSTKQGELQTKPKTTSQPFQFTHVPTNYETNGVPQTQINIDVTETMIHNYIPFANKETGETLLFWNELNQRRMVLAILPKNKLVEIADAISDVNVDLNGSELKHPTKVLEIAQQSAREIYELSCYDEKRVISYIAHETLWQPVLNQREKDWIDAHCTDQYNKPLCRKPNRKNRTTIKELLGKTVSDSTNQISIMSSLLNLQPTQATPMSREKLKAINNIYDSLHHYQPRSVTDLM